MSVSTRSRLKVLISAYACEPYRGSEPGVGWNWAVQAADEHEVWVLTWSKFRAPIEAYQRQYPNPNLHFVYFELPGWAQPLALTERLHYMLWQALVLPMARRMQRRERFDVVHHLTFNSVEVPGLLWTLGVPFVWGPVGGGQVPPAALRSYFRAIWPVELARSLRKRLLAFNPLVRLVATRAACILVSNADTARRLKPFATAPLIDEVEIGVDLPVLETREAPGEVMNIVWAGRLIARKGPLLALDVASELKRRGVPFRLAMAGDGPWQALVAERIQTLGLSSEVELAGLLSHEDMASFYARGDVFLFTSLQDTNGSVVLEAMAHALPVISLDQHGAAALVSDDCGIKVRVGTQQQVISDLAEALQSLARDRAWCRLLGEAARERVASRFTWAHKGQLLRRLYAEAAGADREPVEARPLELAGAGER